MEEIELSGTSTNVGSYVYDYNHLRSAKTVSGTTTYYVYGLNGLLYGEYDTSGNFIREYVYLNDQPFAQIDSGSPETLTYLHTDHLGTPRFGTNTSGTQVWSWGYDAFGTSAPSGSATINLRFAGQYFDDESDLHYNWHRYYDPAIGRYISSDPIGLEGGMNTFNYAEVSPLMYSDPYGLQASSASAAGGSALPMSTPVKPGLRPPLAIGSPENEAITQWLEDGTQKVGETLLRICLFAITDDPSILFNEKDEGDKDSNDQKESDEPEIQDLQKIPEKEGNRVAQEEGYDDAHDAKRGRGDSRVNLYRDKKTGKIYIWDGKKTSEPEKL